MQDAMRMSLASLALAMAGLVASPAQATVIDNFDVSTAAQVVDSSADSSGVTGPGSPRSEGPVVSDWTRTLGADLAVGDSVQTENCPACGAGHVVADAGITLSSGVHFFDWSGSSLDISDAIAFAFDWSSDASAANMTAYVDFSDGTETVRSSFISLMADSALTTYSLGLPAFGGGGPGYDDVTSIRLWFDGGTTIGGYDGNIDNVRTIVPVPEPPALALAGVGLLVMVARLRTSRA